MKNVRLFSKDGAMRKSATPAICVMHKKLKKHILRSGRRKFKNLNSLDSSSYEPSILKWLNLPKARKNRDRKNSKGSVTLPKDFSIFDKPEECLHCIFTKFPEVFYNNKVVNLDHSKVEKWSLGAEVLLGVIAKDIKSDLIMQDKEFSFDGETGDDLEYKQVLAAVGLIKNINANMGFEVDNSPKIHVFEANGFYYETPSAHANDRRKQSVEAFTLYLEGCLKDHNLILSEDARVLLESCLSEVLDNTIEHSGERRPNWRIRGFLSNKHERKTLELSVFNLGQSISKTFIDLPRGNPSRKAAFEYVDRHLDVMSRDQLLTVWALQGGESSKNDGVNEKTRGMGTVALIEAFESIFNSYRTLRNPPEGDCKMNIISGSVVVNFDGTYHSKILESDDGSERVIIPFNRSESLEDAPDKRAIKSMNRVSFPGVMVNISFPLKGSVTPLDK